MPVQAEKKQTASFEAMLSLCLQRLPDGLLSAADRERHLEAARQLPVYFSGMIFFESYIDRPDAGLGLSLAASKGGSGWRFLDGSLPASQEDLFNHPAWQRVRRFCANVSENGSDYAAGVSKLWLEFDVDQYQRLVPDVYVDFAHSPLRGGRARPVIETMSLILRESDLAASAAALERCLAAMPAGGVYEVGLMLARPFAGVRLQVGLGQGMDGIYRYLADIGWPGSLAELQAKTAWLDNCADKIKLMIDVAGAVQPQVGLEAYPADIGADKARWAALLDCFARRGLCHPVKQAALLAFPGGTLEVMGLPFQLWRQLNHLKLVYAPQRPPQAKGYFYFWPTWGRMAVRAKDDGGRSDT